MTPDDVAFSLQQLAESGDFALKADGKLFFAGGVATQSKAQGGSSSGSTSGSIAGQGVWLLAVIAVAGAAFLAFVILFVARRRSARRGKDGGRVVGNAVAARTQDAFLNPMYADVADGSALKSGRQASVRSGSGPRGFENPLYEETGKVNPLFDGFVGMPEDEDGVYNEIGQLDAAEGESFYQDMPGAGGERDTGYLDVTDMADDEDTGYLDVANVRDEEGTGYHDVGPEEEATAPPGFEEDSAMFGFSAGADDDEDSDGGGYLDVADDEEDE